MWCEPGKPPLVLHLIYNLALGGLETGLVNLINLMPAERYRHAIACLTIADDFSRRLKRADVPVIPLERRSGKVDCRVYQRLWRVFAQLQPAILHTRNLPSLDAQLFATIARVPVRIHGEHGRDVHDLDGSKMKYNFFRKAMRPFIHHYTAVSRDLAEWLVSNIGIPRHRVTQIYNGVDTARFQPRRHRDGALFPQGFLPEGAFVIGTVGRMHAVKDQPTLVRAFLRLLKESPAARERARLVMVGDGPLVAPCRELLRAAGAEHLAWLPGKCSDVPELLRAMDLFVSASLAEGISNTILEAMATGLPVVATRVGGTPELVDDGETGLLVPPSNPTALAAPIRTYFEDRAAAARHGSAGRTKVQVRFSLDSMVAGYVEVYDGALKQPATVAVAPA
jgi:sugar transferase (PEP-CTERM/EpsH1 system associated)